MPVKVGWVVVVASDYASHDALDLAALIRRKEVSPLELVETAVRAIERLNPDINAVITPLFEEAPVAGHAVCPARGSVQRGGAPRRSTAPSPIFLTRITRFENRPHRSSSV